MTKSPMAVAREALAVGQRSLPAYSSKFSRRDYTLAQLFALLVLRKFFRTDYRGVVAIVAEWTELQEILRLTKTSRSSHRHCGRQRSICGRDGFWRTKPMT